MASIYLDSGDTSFNIANNNTTVYGQAGTEQIVINAGVTGVTADQNVERVDLAGAAADFTYQQQGNQMLVYSSGTLVATIPLQGDADGTQVVFSDGSVEAKLTAGVMTLGGATVGSTAAAVTPTTIDSSTTSEAVPATTTPKFSIASSSSTVTEGSNAVFTVTLSDAQSASTTVDYTISGDGGAVLGTDTGIHDPAGNSGTLTFAAGEVTKTITLPVTFDSNSETGEGATVTLSNASTGTSLDTSSATVAFADPVAPTFTITSDATAGAATEEGQTITYTITPDSITDKAYTFTLSTVGDTLNGVASAADASDFSPASQTVTFAAGTTTAQTVVQTIVNDGTTEGLEGYKTSLLDSSFAVVGNPLTGLIQDSTVPGEGSTFTLTNGADTLDPNSATATLKTTSNNDTFRAPSDGLLTSSDYIDASGGTDTLTASITAADQTIAPTLKSVEDVTLTITAADTNTTTFDATDASDTTKVTIKNAGAASMAASDELITVSNLSKTATLGIMGGTASSGATASEITATFSGAAAGDTQKVDISSAGKTGVLTLSTAETVQITATGTGTSANAIGSLKATAVKNLNIMGSGDLEIGGSDLAATINVDASQATGVIQFTGETAATSTTFTGGSGNTTVTTASTGTNTITTGNGNDTINNSGGNGTDIFNTGAGDDRVLVGASSNVTSADTIDGGADTDTIAVTDTAVNATVKTNLAKGSSNFEYVETTATAEVTVDFNALSSFDTVIVSGASGATAAPVAAGPGTAGTSSIATTIENEDTLVISAARIGQQGGSATETSGTDVGGIGGNGLTLTPKVDAGANSATIKLIGNADITGGQGGDDTSGHNSADTLGSGGDGVNAANIETLNIEIAGTQASTGSADTVSFTGGAIGSDAAGAAVGGAAGSSLVVGTNATVNITDSLYGTNAALYNNLDLGTVVGTNVTINASTFHGKLTATAATGNVSITGGTGADTLTAGAGTDAINGGTGNDVIDGGNGADTLTGGGGRDWFVNTTALDSDTTDYDKVEDFGKVTEVTTAAETQAMNNATNFQATATGKGGADADAYKFDAAASLEGAESGVDVAAGSGNAGKTITANQTAKGIITLGGTDAALIDTLTEWVGVANTVADTTANVVAFEFNSNTYLFYQDTVTGDDLVQLTGVTGVTGIVLAGSNVAANVGDIFVQ